MMYNTFKSNWWQYLIALCLILVFWGCQSKEDPSKVASGETLLTLLKESETGIDFNNQISTKKDFNYFLWPSIYNGAGVGIGDVNNDGLPDIYFGGNMVADRLYINKGDFKFEDVSKSAGIGERLVWSSGISMADVNGDGWLDIYVCKFGWADQPGTKTNLLYINNRDGTFSEQARTYGIANDGYSIQASFFDYDNDNDLDLYLVNQPNGLRQFMSSYKADERDEKYINPGTSDRLYRNEGNGKFTDVTEAAGVRNFAFGLNVVTTDIDKDGWQDIYISNDYDKPDYLYINNGNGTFTDRLQEMTGHVSNFAMGSDVIDINNDNLPDIAVVDMQAADHYRSKTNMASMSPETFWGQVEKGLHHQYMVNTLQLNNGNGSFSEIGQMAGISKTDWSWTVLGIDMDLDGLKDILVTNGIIQDIRNSDYVEAVKNIMVENKGQLNVTQVYEMSKRAPSVPLSNYAFHNNGDLTFKNKTNEWGFDEMGFSHGMAYGDFDNDGDPDLVVNNSNGLASVYRNNATEVTGNTWFKLRLHGPKGNSHAVGARVEVAVGESSQLMDMKVVRGFMSSVEPVLLFGMGKATQIDRLKITWPDGKETVLRGLPTNELLEVRHASGKPAVPTPKNESTLFSPATAINQLGVQHIENSYDDFQKEVLLPHKQSENGPYIAVADVDGNGHEDFFVGGAANQSGTLYLQQNDGTFTKGQSQPWQSDKRSEDLGCLFFDADNDADLDLYVVSGGNEFVDGAPELQDRLYLNNGKGRFTKSVGALPEMLTSGQAVAASDIDNDGDLDLFVGGRVVPGNYPSPPRSYLLLNEEGRFSDVTGQNTQGLESPGMVTDAEFFDFDKDGDADLVISGEWMSIMIFQNDNGIFSDISSQSGLADMSGWWFSIDVADADGDGDPDLVAGNLGKNAKFKASTEKPFVVFGYDFDQNGQSDIVLANTSNDKLVPVRGRECSSEQVPLVAEKFPSFHEFALASVEEIYSPSEIEKALRYEVTELRSCFIRNDGNGQFSFVPLPNLSQVGPLRDVLFMDANSDGNLDIIGAGNLYGAEVETVRYDGGIGVCLLGDGKGNFSTKTVVNSGFFAAGDVRDIAPIKIGENPSVLIGVNNNGLSGFKIDRSSNELGQQ